MGVLVFRLMFPRKGAVVDPVLPRDEQEERLNMTTEQLAKEIEAKVHRKRLQFKEKRDNAVRVQRAVYAQRVAHVDDVEVDKQQFEHLKEVKRAMQEERKQRLREIRLAKDGYRSYQSEIRVKTPVRAQRSGLCFSLFSWNRACCTRRLGSELGIVVAVVAVAAAVAAAAAAAVFCCCWDGGLLRCYLIACRLWGVVCYRVPQITARPRATSSLQSRAAPW